MEVKVPTKIACIGAGYWGVNLVRNFHSLNALGWVCEPDRDRRDQLAAAYRDQRMIQVLFINLKVQFPVIGSDIRKAVNRG